MERCIQSMHPSRSLAKSINGMALISSSLEGTSRSVTPSSASSFLGLQAQAVRNAYDLNCMSVPQKFRAIGDFHEYYSGARLAPYLTLFVGGNHEASSHLQELYYGGWAAPNIYYLGAANVVRLGGLRIAGLSGIWKGYNYNKSHFERVPYTADEIKSLYHVREIDVRKLLLLRSQVDVGLSHDWPRGVEWQGDYKALFRKKDLFEADARAGTLGSSAAKYVMDRLRPPYWFSAHLHCKFAAVVDYSEKKPVSESLPNGAENREVHETKNTDGIDFGLVEEAEPAVIESSGPMKNDAEIDLDMEDDSPIPTPAATTSNSDSTPKVDTTPTALPSVSLDIRSQLPASFSRPPPSQVQTSQPPPPPPEITNTTTNFLALDKCLPNRQFLQFLTIDPLSPFEPPAPLKLTYDPEWLSILRVFAPHDPHLPSPQNIGEPSYKPLIETERAWVEENVVQKQKLQIPENFELTAPVYDGRDIRSVGRAQSKEWSNPQTKAFCELVGIPNHFDSSEEERARRRVKKESEIAAEDANGSRGRGGSGGRRGGGRGGRDGGRGRGRGRGR